MNTTGTELKFYLWILSLGTYDACYTQTGIMLASKVASAKNIVDSRYLEAEWTLWNTSRYPYFDISDLQTWWKYHLNNQISQINM